MKKVGIVTINDLNNYGNRLQCYATQEYLKKFDVDVENIYNDNISGLSKVKRKVKDMIKFFVKNKSQMIMIRRRKEFKEFNQNVKYSKYKIINSKYNKNINEAYDCFFVGSDQVWNPNFNTTSDTTFLTFADEKKRNAFSASFGISELSDEIKESYKERLSAFNAISVREDSGKEIINKLIEEKDVEVLLDPTMLLSVQEWDKVSKKPRQSENLKKKYILTYFLGNLSKERQDEINRVAKENDCEIINILDKKSNFYSTGPSEFLYLEKNAFLICTDSFHSAVFSIIYNRPFIVFNREDKKENMNSRLETLLKKFNLEDRFYKGKITAELLKCNYEKTYQILTKEIEKTDKFVKKILEENE